MVGLLGSIVIPPQQPTRAWWMILDDFVLKLLPHASQSGLGGPLYSVEFRTHAIHVFVDQVLFWLKYFILIYSTITTRGCLKHRLSCCITNNRRNTRRVRMNNWWYVVNIMPRRLNRLTPWWIPNRPLGFFTYSSHNLIRQIGVSSYTVNSFPLCVGLPSFTRQPWLNILMVIIIIATPC